MKSLRIRLFVILMSMVIFSWMLWILAMVGTTQKSGWLKSKFRESAEQILYSMPNNVHLLGESPSPNGYVSQEYQSPDNETYQILLDGKIIMQSPRAPSFPMKQNLQDGFSEEMVNGKPWLVYVLSDPKRGIQVQLSSNNSFWSQIKGLLSFSFINICILFVLLALAIWWVIRRSMASIGVIQESAQKENLSISLLFRFQTYPKNLGL